MAEIVIAVRSGLSAKTRCAPALNDDQRIRLVEAMLEDMLVAANLSARAEGVWVVTPNAELASILRRHDARLLVERQDAGLNGAFGFAADEIGDARPFADIAFLPGDLPLLAPSDLDAALALVTTHPAVLAPSRSDGGTGALILRAGTAIEFAFGPHSFARHFESLSRRGINPAVVTAYSLSADIDRPEDFPDLLERGAKTKSAEWLRECLIDRVRK